MCYQGPPVLWLWHATPQPVWEALDSYNFTQNALAILSTQVVVPSSEFLSALVWQSCWFCSPLSRVQFIIGHTRSIIFLTLTLYWQASYSVNKWTLILALSVQRYKTQRWDWKREILVMSSALPALACFGGGGGGAKDMPTTLANINMR